MRNTHLYVIAEPFRRAFGVKAHEIETRACFAGREILAARAVLQKIVQESNRLRRSRTGAVRTADVRLWYRTQNGVDGKIVELEVFLRRSVPIIDIRFVPDFPKSRLHFIVAVALTQMLCEAKHKLRPLRIILRRIRPAGKNISLRKGTAVRIGMRRKRFGHKPELHEWLHAGFVKGIKDVVENRPVVDGLSGSVFRINVRRAPLQRSIAV